MDPSSVSDEREPAKEDPSPPWAARTGLHAGATKADHPGSRGDETPHERGEPFNRGPYKHADTHRRGTANKIGHLHAGFGTAAARAGLSDIDTDIENRSPAGTSF